MLFRKLVNKPFGHFQKESIIQTEGIPLFVNKKLKPTTISLNNKDRMLILYWRWKIG